MIDTIGDWERSHHCSALRAGDAGNDVCLMGWVNRARDHGGVIFVDLRDREGITQVVFDPSADAELFSKSEKLRSEFVIGVLGTVRHRPDGMENPNLPTGEIEVLVHELKILNTSDPTPIVVSEEGDEDERVRMKYRYLDLRRRRMQRNLFFRSRVSKVTRDFLDENGFYEIETPFLGKSTPEGARDYLVPCRLIRGTFYALPQSPQLYKQTLMASGIEKYYQLARCMRDEDLRADRQPEHTQIDIEMSFVREDHIFGIIEGLLTKIFKAADVEIETPFPRMTYAEAMTKYGSDKPDLRFDMPIHDATAAIRGSSFKVFEGVIENGGAIRGFNIKGGAKMSRKEIDDLIVESQRLGSTGLAWMRVAAGGKLESNIVKYFDDERQAAIAKAMEAEEGDLLTFVAGKPETISPILGELRLIIAKKTEMPHKTKFAILWVTNFPLFEWDAERKGWSPMHHIFTMPREEDMPALDSDPSNVLGRQYDVVINGVEMGSGSIRIHNEELQKKVLGLIGMSEERAREMFGFLLDAFRFGAPPHGGVALGMDRLCTVLLGENSIRDVIAFPKTQTGACLLTNAPSEVELMQLREVGIRVAKAEKKPEDAE